MSIGKSRLGRQSPYQDDLVAPPRPKDVDQREVDGHVRGGYADQHHGAREVARVERLLERLGAADRVDHDVRCRCRR
jgi:hypothetical protein